MTYTNRAIRTMPNVEEPDEEQEWPPRRPCTDCNLLIGEFCNQGVQRAGERYDEMPREARWVITHLSGVQWYACDQHADGPLHEALHIHGTICGRIPIAEWWERIAAEDATKRLDGTWRPS